MTQDDLFENKNHLIISADKGEAEYIPNFLNREEADDYFSFIFKTS